MAAGREREGVDGKVKNSSHTIYGKTLIPPRISLQSRLAPAFYRSNLGEEPAATQTNVALMALGENGELKASSENNLLTRFARRVTSSLAAIGFYKRSGTPPESGDYRNTAARDTTNVVVNTISAQETLDFPSIPASFHDGMPTMNEMREAAHIADQMTIPPLEQMFDTPWNEAFRPLPSSMGSFSASMTSISSSMGSVAVSQTGRGRYRLAGHTTKIHLQAASPVAMAKETLASTQIPLSPTAPRVPIAGTRRKESVSAYMPAVQKGSEKRASEDVMATHAPGLLPDTPMEMMRNSAYLTALKPVQTARKTTNAGSGVFESAQRDVTINHEQVSATSTVLVTLTSDPGPVVVHFVTLQPGVGFTVHLTAPASKQATFNYIIL
ncbi:hypothetical protein KSD_52510 [Ktedonobacter sp. SOSP1-85]|nr:hypothetical protein KSD_52510 [Ktedonobacter sp. SOSP1-85]